MLFVQVKEDNAKKILTKKTEYKSFFPSGTDDQEFQSLLESNKDIISYLKVQTAWVRSVLNLKPGQRAVVANGKVRIFLSFFFLSNFT